MRWKRQPDHGLLNPAALWPCRYTCIGYTYFDAFAASLPRAPGYPGSQLTADTSGWCWPRTAGKGPGIACYTNGWAFVDVTTLAASFANVPGEFLLRALGLENVCDAFVTPECVQHLGLRKCE